MKKKFRITLNGKSYDVVAEVMDDEGAAGAPEAGTGRRARSAGAGAVATPATKAPSAGGGAGDLPSPLAGKVVSLDVAVGQSIAAGDKVMTLEAMKMNTVVTAPAGGTIQAILVKPGDSVEEGQSLLTIQ
jgi:biotin carboxyl carrier protein